jgi:hypothetical protein
LSPVESLADLRERRYLRKAKLGGKLAVWRGYEAQTPEERIRLGLEPSEAAFRVRRTEKHDDAARAPSTRPAAGLRRELAWMTADRAGERAFSPERPHPAKAIVGA